MRSHLSSAFVCPVKVRFSKIQADIAVEGYGCDSTKPYVFGSNLRQVHFLWSLPVQAVLWMNAVIIIWEWSENVGFQ